MPWLVLNEGKSEPQGHSQLAPGGKPLPRSPTIQGAVFQCRPHPEVLASFPFPLRILTWHVSELDEIFFLELSLLSFSRVMRLTMCSVDLVLDICKRKEWALLIFIFFSLSPFQSNLYRISFYFNAWKCIANIYQHPIPNEWRSGREMLDRSHKFVMKRMTVFTIWFNLCVKNMISFNMTETCGICRYSLSALSTI